MSLMQNLSRKVWRSIALRKVRKTKNIGILVEAIQVIGEYGSPMDFQILLPYISDERNVIRLNATIAIRKLFKKDPEKQAKKILIDELENASLLKRLTIIEILQELPLSEREEIFRDLIHTATDDLLYAVIQSLRGTTDIDLLDTILDAANTKDLVLRKIAYQAWFEGIQSMQKDKRLEYTTPRLHQLIRATYETRDKGKILNFVLGNANLKELPDPKAYPEFIIRYLIELINSWEYDPSVNKNIHQLVVPAYFTFKEQQDMEERPYIQI